jgi:hypothetical protein
MIAVVFGLTTSLADLASFWETSRPYSSLADQEAKPCLLACLILATASSLWQSLPRLPFCLPDAA